MASGIDENHAEEQQSSVSEDEWQLLNGIDVETSEFPVRARVAGESIVVFQTANGFRGVERQCPHQKMPLHDAVLQGANLLRCRWHSYVYRLSDGKGVNCPGYTLKVFEVRQEGNALYARAAV